jgi:hypothetical protein
VVGLVPVVSAWRVVRLARLVDDLPAVGLFVLVRIFAVRPGRIGVLMSVQPVPWPQPSPQIAAAVSRM